MGCRQTELKITFKAEGNYIWTEWFWPCGVRGTFLAGRRYGEVNPYRRVEEDVRAIAALRHDCVSAKCKLEVQ